MPLTSLLELSGKSELAENLVHSSLYVVCLGLRGSSRHKDITGIIRSLSQIYLTFDIGF